MTNEQIYQAQSCNAVKRLREKLGLSLDQFAEQAGKHRMTVSKWERQERIPKYAALMDLAKAFNVKLKADEKRIIFE